jgi:abortive infection bacteriophage resistance protein
MEFKKPALGSEDLLNQLTARGLPLSQDQREEARSALRRIGYYRLTGYMLPFQYCGSGYQKHHFKKGATLDGILSLYEFDRALRNLCLEAIEPVEVAVKVSICDHMSRSHGPHWYLRRALMPKGDHGKLLEELFDAVEFDQTTNSGKKKLSGNHLFLSSYYRKYTKPASPPGWMVRECSSFRVWAKIYESLDSGDAKQISDNWLYPDGKRIDHTILSNWLHSVSVFRNRCAHHSRLVYRSFQFAPVAPQGNVSSALFGPQTNDLRSILLVLAILLKSAAPNSQWVSKLHSIFDSTPGVDFLGATGVSRAPAAGWESDAIWTLR